MDDLSKIVGGCVLLLLGFVIICGRKTIVNMTLDFHEGVDKAIGKHSNMKKHGVIPNVIVILIGIGLSVIGILSFL